MSEYEIGRDLQDLRSRIEALEGGAHGHGANRFAKGSMEKLAVAPGIDPKLRRSSGNSTRTRICHRLQIGGSAFLRR